MKTVNLFLFIVLAGTQFLAAQEPAKKTDLQALQKQEASSYFEAFYTNAEALRTFDVLITVSESYDSIKSKGDQLAAVGEYKRYIRLAADVDNKKMFFGALSSSVINKPDLEKPEQRLEGRSTTKYLALFDGDQAIGRSFVQPDFLLKKDSWMELQNQMMIPEPRAVGLMKFGWNRDFATMEKQVKYFMGGGVKASVKPSSNGDKVAIQLSAESERVKKNYNRIHSFDFDTELMVPIKRKNELIIGKRRGFMDSGRYTWKQIDGITVPASLTEEISTSSKIDGTSHKYILERSVEFDWLVVNEEIDEALFDSENLKNVKRFRELVELPFEKKKSEEEAEDSNEQPKAIIK